ncbi:hypothetical protein [Burkholderia sp. MBR-1]|uniref:hypothetical protein n=1 Tax=Burkholderia sp. MBR-1 TaxID=2732364 RepID=UPI0015EF5CC6|nr:hypothetical protein [Burkholderia sp. MBR-1]QMI49716.1 hypothetical protein MBR110_30025 [Burkholderia sp. MBR-1]
MAAYTLAVDDCLRLLARVDTGEIESEMFYVNGAPEWFVVFDRARIEVIEIAGKAPGVALERDSGRVLVRRGYASSRRLVIAAAEYLTYYWITDAGRTAAAQLLTMHSGEQEKP